ncbi:hypothetical protein DL96DRAFT_1683123 [Flagelloscypha sp. PMI_526]|nr:hypothetical protein DL96DRAFT_1683123 [Flagelloscypha sp. PMI_526]
MGIGSYAHFLLSFAKLQLCLYISRLLPTQRPEWTDLSGKTSLITGANVGIGLEIARGLALRGSTVVLACRNKKKAEFARTDIVEKSKGTIRLEQIEILSLDLSDLSSVRSAVQAWGTRPIDILINNAGMTTGTFFHTPQGYELIYATNILSHYLLTLLLLPHVRPLGRVVNVSSHAQAYPKSFDILDLDHSKYLLGQGFKLGKPISAEMTESIYCRTKCLQVLFTRELQLRLNESRTYKHKKITVHAYHPGLVRSDIWDREDNINITARNRRFLLFAVDALGVSTEEGAATGIFLATSKTAAMTPGTYWHCMETACPNPLTADSEKRKPIFDQLAIEAGLEEELRL